MKKEQKNNHMVGLFGKIEPTLENMNAIAQLHRIIKNYLKMKRIQNNENN